MKNSFVKGVHHYRGNVRGKISELVKMSTELSELKCEELKEQHKGRTETQKLWDNYKRCSTHIMEIHKGED